MTLKSVTIRAAVFCALLHVTSCGVIATTPPNSATQSPSTAAAASSSSSSSSTSASSSSSGTTAPYIPTSPSSQGPQWRPFIPFFNEIRQTIGQMLDTISSRVSEVLNAGTTPDPSGQTTAAATGSTPTTAPFTSSPPSPPTLCPLGIYNEKDRTVTFLLESVNCEITVYLYKPPKGNKGRGQGGPDKADKEEFVRVASTVGQAPETCPEVSSRVYGKETFILETNQCMMIIAKTKGNKTSPDILSRALG